MITVPPRIIPETEGGMGHDVRVPAARSRYDARTILSMIKLVNRRGIVRLFYEGEDRWFYFRPPKEPIAGLDERHEWVADSLDEHDGSELVVSFEDKFEARTFARDLAALKLPVETLASLKAVRDANVLVAKRLEPSKLPATPVFYSPDGHRSYGTTRWVAMLNAQDQDPKDLTAWMRKHITSKYWAARWRTGTEPVFIKAAYRYWRLKPTQWERLIARCRETSSILLVCFSAEEDRARFDGQYGPASYIDGPNASNDIHQQPQGV